MDLFTALLAAMAVTAVFAASLRKKGPWPGIWMFFTVIFLASWAASLWLIAAGPLIFGVSWMPILAVALIVAVLFVAVSPPRTPLSPEERHEKDEQIQETDEAFNIFFWVLIVLLVLAVFFGYFAVPVAG